MNDTEAMEEALKTVAAWAKRLEHRNGRLEAVNDEWQRLSGSLLRHAAFHLSPCMCNIEPCAPCTCGLDELRNNPLLS